MNRTLVAVAAVGALLVLPAAAMAGHGLILDHPANVFNTTEPPANTFMSGGEDAEWELLKTFPTGNPHSDLDFFTQGGETFVSSGTLGIGPNAGGQEIFQLTQGGEVDPKFVSAHPSASCVSNPGDALGLQHDVEATPKGDVLFNADVTDANRGDTQLLIDASDNGGRCHDQGPLAVSGAPQGGLEIIDVTDVENPVEIGLTSHIGEAHTVNVDPRRPHIAYAVTSDSVSVDNNDTPNDFSDDVRANEQDSSSPIAGPNLSLDGFEIVDLSTCMNFPATATVEQKREACRPQVYRYRYPSTEMSLGHTNQSSVFGCHELEVYPDDRLMCGSGGALIALDMTKVFDDNGTPMDFTDDKVNGTPLPCTVRETSTVGAFETGASITDCVDPSGDGERNLRVAQWIQDGAPSVAGVDWIGSVFHQGRESATGAADPAFDSTEDIDFNHETELSNSGTFLLATDERGGGVAPPGGSCSQGVDNVTGNGGVHVYRYDKLLRRRPASPEDAFSSYALNSEGEKAIYRAPIRSKTQTTFCTAHVFQQIPGQNRIFMGWYSQGTQVLDFTENADGTIDVEEAGFFIPTNANQWTSHVFDVQENADGTFTYHGVVSDFSLAENGRNAVEVFKVTLPPPPKPRGRLPGTGPGFEPTVKRSRCLARRVKIGPRNIGRLRLGQSRTRTASRAKPLGRVSRRTRVLRYCVRGRNRRDRGVAVFDGRGKLRLAATNGRGHRRRGITPGTARRKALRRFGARRVRRLGRGVNLVRGPRRSRSRVVLGIRRGKVRYVAVADRALARKPRVLRRYALRAKLR